MTTQENKTLARPEYCAECERSTQGLDGEPKWCCYCGARLRGAQAPAAIAPAPTVDVAIVQQFLRVLDRCDWLDGHESAWTTKKVGTQQERAAAFTKLRQRREELNSAIAKAQQGEGSA